MASYKVEQMVPEQLRLVKHAAGAWTVVATWGLLHTTTYSTHDWQAFLDRRGWQKVPRVWQSKD